MRACVRVRVGYIQNISGLYSVVMEYHNMSDLSSTVIGCKIISDQIAAEPLMVNFFLSEPRLAGQKKKQKKTNISDHSRLNTFAGLSLVIRTLLP